MEATSQAFQFFLPIGGGGGGRLHLPSSMFIRQPKDTRSSPDLSADEQLACRWRKVRSEPVNAEGFHEGFYNGFLLAVPPAFRLFARLGGPCQRLPCEARKGYWVLLPLGGVFTERAGLQCQVCSLCPLIFTCRHKHTYKLLCKSLTC